MFHRLLWPMFITCQARCTPSKQYSHLAIYARYLAALHGFRLEQAFTSAICSVSSEMVLSSNVIRALTLSLSKMNCGWHDAFCSCPSVRFTKLSGSLLRSNAFAFSHPCNSSDFSCLQVQIASKVLAGHNVCHWPYILLHPSLFAWAGFVGARPSVG